MNAIESIQIREGNGFPTLFSLARGRFTFGCHVAKSIDKLEKDYQGVVVSQKARLKEPTCCTWLNNNNDDDSGERWAAPGST